MSTVTEFLEQFYPDPAEPIWLRSFDAKGLPKSVHGFPQNIETCREQIQTDRGLQNRLKDINSTQGIYFVVNAGGNSDGEITRVNAIFCEMDDRSITEQHDILDNQSPWTPSIRIETKKSVHAYWLLNEALSNDDFLKLQQGLIKFYRSDKSICNLSRVMRVPFFNHVRWDGDEYKYQRVTLHTFDPGRRYTRKELLDGYPYAKERREPEFYEKSGRIETLEDVKAELRRRVMDSDSWKAHGHWGSANAKCHNGEGDTGIRVNFASGSVTCWSKCTLPQILEAYGLELPKSRQFEYIPKQQQNSVLHRWREEQKRKLA